MKRRRKKKLNEKCPLRHIKIKDHRHQRVKFWEKI